LKDIKAILQIIIDAKTTTTSIQNQKHIINEDLYPTNRPKIIPIRNRNNPNQNVTKITNLKYSNVGFIGWYIVVLQ
jgi:hypothetical protein